MSFRLFLVKTLVGLNFFPFIIIDRALTQNSTFSHNKKKQKNCAKLCKTVTQTCPKLIYYFCIALYSVILIKVH